MMAHIVFMGSPQFAVPTLEALARDHTLLAIFTQPNKPAGRGQQLTAVPVKQWAMAHGVLVHQPKSFRKEPRAIEVLRDLKPGTRIVSHSHDMGDWRPEKEIEVEGDMIYFWTVPANMARNSASGMLSTFLKISGIGWS